MDSWVKERILGTGSFGIVTLWKNSKTQQKIGENWSARMQTNQN